MTDTLRDEVGELSEEICSAAVVRLEQIKREQKALKAEDAELTQQIKDGKDLLLIDDDAIRMYGLTPANRDGGYDDGIVGLLKERGYRDAVVVKEVADQKQVKELVGSGQLTEADVEPYKKADSFYMSLPREKKG